MATEAQRRYGRRKRQKLREMGKRSIFIYVDELILGRYKDLAESQEMIRDDLLVQLIEESISHTLPA